METIFNHKFLLSSVLSLNYHNKLLRIKIHFEIKCIYLWHITSESSVTDFKIRSCRSMLILPIMTHDILKTIVLIMSARCLIAHWLKLQWFQNTRIFDVIITSHRLRCRKADSPLESQACLSMCVSYMGVSTVWDCPRLYCPKSFWVTHISKWHITYKMNQIFTEKFCPLIFIVRLIMTTWIKLWNIVHCLRFITFTVVTVVTL